MSDTITIDVPSCKSCGKPHPNLTASVYTFPNGRKMAKWKCPTTGKRGATSIKSTTAPKAAKAAKAPKPAKSAKAAAKAAAHEASAARHEHEAAHHEHEAAADLRRAAKAPKAAKKPKAAKEPTHKPHTGARTMPTPSNARHFTLGAHVLQDINTADGWHVAVGILEYFVEHGMGGMAAASAFSQADAVARQVAAKTGKGDDKRDEQRELGRDIGRILEVVMTSARIDPVTWIALYPRELAAAYAAITPPKEQYDAAKKGALPESWARRSPDLSQAMGYDEGQASVWSRLGTGFAGGMSGMKAGAMFGPYGEVIGGVLGAFFGVMAPEMTETADQWLGTDKDERDQRANDIAGPRDVKDVGGSSVPLDETPIDGSPIRIPPPGGGPQLQLPTGR